MKVDTPMIRMVTRKVYLRPTRSPRRPNTSAPNGRTRKPAAKASSAKTLRVVASNAEKNCAPMIDGERAVEIEVVPFEDRAERRGEDDLLLLPGHGADLLARCCRRHAHLDASTNLFFMPLLKVAERFSFPLRLAAGVICDDEYAVPAPQSDGHALVCTSIVRLSNWTLVYGLFQSASVELALVNLLAIESVVYEVSRRRPLDFLLVSQARTRPDTSTKV